MSGFSREDFEFGEQIAIIGLALGEIRAPTMVITNELLMKIQTALLRSKILVKHTLGFETVFGRLESIQSIIEEMLATNSPVIEVSSDDKKLLMEHYAELKDEVVKAYAHI